MQAMASCREAGYKVDESLFADALKFSLKSFRILCSPFSLNLTPMKAHPPITDQTQFSGQY